METPGIWARIRAFARGERHAETLYAYRRAGAEIHPLLDAAERRRFDLTLSGTSPFAVQRHVGLELVCTWNAFTLQTLGDKMLEADELADPDTVGFVPPVTFDQVQAYYTEVQLWLGYASQAGHDPEFDLPPGKLPARLPEWSPVEPCPRPHLDAMIAALHTLRGHAEVAMHNLEQTTPEADKPRLARLQGQFAQAMAKANYTANMYVPDASLALHEQIEEHAKRAIEDLYRVGQLISYPALLVEGGRAATSPGKTKLKRTPLPGEPGFDPWVMTDPEHVAQLQRNKNAQRVIGEMWDLDPDPAASVALWDDIRRAVDTGAAVLAKNKAGRSMGHYFCTPYCAIYEAKRPLVIGDTPVPQGQQFTLECAAEGVRIGYPFKREVVIGDFRAAAIDYCDPDQPPPHDE